MIKSPLKRKWLSTVDQSFQATRLGKFLKHRLCLPALRSEIFGSHRQYNDYYDIVTSISISTRLVQTPTDFLIAAVHWFII